MTTASMSSATTAETRSRPKDGRSEFALTGVAATQGAVGDSVVAGLRTRAAARSASAATWAGASGSHRITGAGPPSAVGCCVVMVIAACPYV